MRGKEEIRGRGLKKEVHQQKGEEPKSGNNKLKEMNRQQHRGEASRYNRKEKYRN